MFLGESNACILRDWEHATYEKGTLPRASSWQLLCDGFYVKGDSSYRDYQHGKDGMRVVEATSTTIVIYDVFNRTVNSQHFKNWSPLLDSNMDIEPDDEEMDEDEISILLLHPRLNIVFWGTVHGVVGAYDFDMEKFVRRVHLPQIEDYDSDRYEWELIFSITLNMLVIRCLEDPYEYHLFTWTLNDEHVERIIGLDDHRICDLHNNQVQLLVTNGDSLDIWDLRQRKELYTWHTEDKNSTGIHDAKFSCDGELVYALFGFGNMSIGVFDATAGLQLRCRITPSAYSLVRDQSLLSYWTSIVAHPQKRNQFAILPMSSKVIYVIEPSHELGGEWVCKANEGVGRQI